MFDLLVIIQGMSSTNSNKGFICHKRIIVYSGG